ncbi:MAG: carboxy-S-adenosyl-L-methionine synthase CmoA [Pseudomonadales bacterium]
MRHVAGNGVSKLTNAMTNDKKDTIFSRPLGEIAGFSFDESVAAVFPDMIQRSVPGYNTVIAISGVLAEQFSQQGSRIYDLGCSLGATTLAMAQGLPQDHCEIIAVDNSRAMLDRARQVIDQQALPVPVQLRCEDLCAIEISTASVVALNFTLQFVDVAQRLALLKRIHAGMHPGGVLILSEKIRFADAALNTLFIDLYHDFKRTQGYSDLEISQKRTALENVLIPETLEDHRARLNEAGFTRVAVWFQCFNFASLVAFK